MINIKDFINSGIIESFVLGLTTDAETKKVEELASAHREIRAAIDDFSLSVEEEAKKNAIEPPHTVKPLLMAIFDYIKRLTGGEPMSHPPLLSESSKISDYAEWINRPDMNMNVNFNDIHVKLISHTPQATTGIVWIKEMAPEEVHDDELERFLIVEGTCEITIGDNVHKLVPGDFLAIPLYSQHFVKVTSKIPCKVILQRVAIAA